MSYPYPIFGSQDLHDDDGAVIDSFLIETDAPPDLKQATQPIDPPAVKAPARITRIMTRDMTLDPSWTTPTMLFPADGKRKGLGLRVNSPTAVATDGVRIGSDLGEMNTAGRIFHGQTLTDILSTHTGAVWLLPCGNGTNGVASAPISVEAWAVTDGESK
jgi:hypothetical protein